MKKLKWIWMLVFVVGFTVSPFSSSQAQFSDSLHYRFSSDTAVWDEELAAYTITLDFEMKWDVPGELITFMSAALDFNTALYRFQSFSLDSANWQELHHVVQLDTSNTIGEVSLEWTDGTAGDTIFSLTTGEFVRYGFVSFIIIDNSEPFQGDITFPRWIGNHMRTIQNWFLLESGYTDGVPLFLGVSETPCCSTPGDTDNNGQFNIADVTQNIARIFSGGPQAPCTAEADADANGFMNIADVTYMIARIFSGGDPPACVSIIP